VSQPLTVLCIDHVVLRVRHLEESVRFYQDVLGCHVERRREDLGLVHLRAGASMIDLISLAGRLGQSGGAGPATEGRNVDHICLRVDAFDEPALAEYLRRHNVEPIGPATTNFGAEGHGPSLYIRDLDGNLIELKGPSPQM
jgi:glyoxylase I family protein